MRNRLRDSALGSGAFEFRATAPLAEPVLVEDVAGDPSSAADDGSVFVCPDADGLRVDVRAAAGRRLVVRLRRTPVDGLVLRACDLLLELNRREERGQEVVHPHHPVTSRRCRWSG